MTMSSDMNRFRDRRRGWAWIIWCLLPWLAGCSALRLGYANGPELAYWWLDGYVDFNSEQTPRVRQALRTWFDWHRTTQLPDYVTALAALRDAADRPVTAEQACDITAQWRRRMDVALERAVPLAAEFARQLSPAQLQHIERRFAKGNAEFRDEYLQAQPVKRRDATLKRAVERVENFYGRLDEAQAARLAADLADSPFDPAAWLAEREALQRELLRSLHSLAEAGADDDRAQAALRAAIAHQMRSPHPRYRDYQERLTRFNCALFARLHNQMSAPQRQRAAAKLKDWEDDLRAIAGLSAASP